MAREHFDPTEYLYFIDYKSHGSEMFVGTGLLRSQEEFKKKVTCQNEALKQLFESQPEFFIAAKDGSLVTRAQLNEALGQVGLGQVGLGQVGIGQGLGQVGLGQVGLGQIGLGQVGLGSGGLGIAGLGVHGLGVDNHFGMQHLGLATALEAFNFNGTGEEEIGFLFLESCQSRVERDIPSLKQDNMSRVDPLTLRFQNLDNVYGFYSAKYSIWYRNVNWKDIYAKWRQGPTTAARFQAILEEATSNIKNYIYSDN